MRRSKGSLSSGVSVAVWGGDWAGGEAETIPAPMMMESSPNAIVPR